MSLYKKKIISDIYYFGCWSRNDGGHFLYHPSESYITSSELDELAISTNTKSALKNIDGFMIFRGDKQSEANLGVIDGWTFLKFVDYTGDSRSGSNSGFVAKGVLSFDEVILLARRSFPRQVTRIEASSPIRLKASTQVKP